MFKKISPQFLCYYKLLICSLGLISIINAQIWVQNDAIFNPSGIPSVTFSAPRFTDLDNDDDFDLILGGSAIGLLFLENIGSSSVPHFALTGFITHDISMLEAEIGALADMDNDGDPDLIGGGYLGLTYFENIGDINTQIFQRDTTVLSVITVGMYPVPTLADLNADGITDLLVGLSEVGSIKYYLNTGTATEPAFNETDATSPGIDIGLYAYPYLADPDIDGDFDLIIGRDDHSLFFYRNNGTPDNPQWEYESDYFSGIATDKYFVTPCLVDLNGDSVDDLIYGHYGGPLHYFINTGTGNSPTWTENFTVFGGTMDVGGASNPFLFDFENDGDLDLISGHNLGGIKFYRNIGSTSAPAWESDDTPFSSIDLSIYSSVTVGDINSDDLPELLMGDVGGSLYLYENTGSQFIQNTTFFSSISIGWWLIPRFIDMDNDRDLDVIVGNDAGDLHYFENQGTSVSADFVLIDNYFNGVAGPTNCSPALADFDHDGDIDLLLGGISSSLRYFQNTGSSQLPVWTDSSAIFSLVTVSQNATPAFGDLDGDGDYDLTVGTYDGNLHYFENRRPSIAVDKSPAPTPDEFQITHVFPNPFNGSVTFSMVLPEPGRISIDFYDLCGRQIHREIRENLSSGKSRLNLHFPSDLASGVYLYRAFQPTSRIVQPVTGKLLYMK